MKIQSIPFSAYGFRALFTDYIHQKKEIGEFYELHPFDLDAAEKRLKELQKVSQENKFNGSIDSASDVEPAKQHLSGGNGSAEKRNALVSALKAFHQPFTDRPEVFEQIQKLENPETYVVVTGQQLTLFGGPLYTLYKIATTIHYAKTYSKSLNREVIPVFWLADEDHDLEEIQSVRTFSADLELCTIRCDEPDHEKPASEIYFSEKALKEAFAELGKVMPETDFTEGLLHRLQKMYTPGTSFKDAFAAWVLDLFAEDGLILCGSNDEALKNLGRAVFRTYIEQADEFYRRVDVRSSALQKLGYHEQVHPMRSNLFMYDEDHRRMKLNIEEGGWKTGLQTATMAEVKKIVEERPYKLSPNVLLRPIIQDELLPVLAYVAGPSELSYYAQLKDVYPLFGKKMPVIIPRFSITLIEPHIARAAKQLPFEWPDYRLRTEDLETEYLKSTNSPDLNRFFATWIQTIHQETEKRKGEISGVDPTLLGTASKAESIYKNELMKLKGKMIRSIKQQEEDQLGRIRKVKHHLFPDGNLQERELSSIYLMNKYGPGIIHRLMQILQQEQPDTHKLIYL